MPHCKASQFPRYVLILKRPRGKPDTLEAQDDKAKELLQCSGWVLEVALLLAKQEEVFSVHQCPRVKARGRHYSVICPSARPRYWKKDTKICLPLII